MPELNFNISLPGFSVLAFGACTGLGRLFSAQEALNIKAISRQDIFSCVVMLYACGITANVSVSAAVPHFQGFL